ncbi:hypothetical protein CPJCM30710_29630 [Clostridium polyendosporum]|uniref:Anti-sigma-W factor RsiW n=1 Tax=Clostridium polyendosporum TaxID=69208 RepID=A0A919S1B9_9CLOT|nr:DUF4349 domain-containing protein [Clostridium polyendosporum]GIM30297.1 hypothetical protein CPJCM30710_29630 [Clostridium polyendosporum]
MNHERYQELMSRDMDNDLSEEEKKELLKHLEECESCRNKQEELKKINKAMTNIEEVNPGVAWKEQTAIELRREKIKKFRFGKYIPYAAGIVILFIIAGLIITNVFFRIEGRGATSTNNSTVYDYDKGVSGESSSGTVNKNESSTGTTAGVMGSDVEFDITKIIYSGNISLYSDDYKSTFAKIGEYAVNIGGFVQNSSSSYADKVQNTVVNSGYITIRVPAVKFEEAMKEIQKYGSPISTSTQSTNISQQYQDIKGQLDNLKIQEERLLEYLKKAEKIQDMLSIESELNRVRTEIDYRTTMIKNWDKEVVYSTIYVSVTEKKLATSTVKSPFSDILPKIKKGFIASINCLLNIFAELIVWIFRLIPFAAVLGAAYFIYTRSRKKKQ